MFPLWMTDAACFSFCDVFCIASVLMLRCVPCGVEKESSGTVNSNSLQVLTDCYLHVSIWSALCICTRVSKYICWYPCFIYYLME